jgi:vancomycin resistance protein VanJ
VAREPDPAAKPGPPTPPARTSRRGKFATGCLGLIVLGVAFQLLFRDRYPFPWAGVFYALPRPLMCGLAIAGFVLARGKIPRVLWAGLTLALAGWTAARDVAWHAPRIASGASRSIVYWNVGHDLFDDVAVVDEFLRQQPAVLGLVEIGPLKPEWLSAWRSRHPEYEFFLPGAGCLLAVRGRILDGQRISLENRGHLAWVDAEIEGTRLRAAVVDVHANPWVSRKEPLRAVSEWLASGPEGPRIVMGDFNTPDDSFWFDGLKSDYREVFRAAGRGYAPTWPWPVPVLKLDQIWVSRQVEVHGARQGTTWRSDHRPQWAEVSW